jgi:hypothetical protein
MKIMKKTFIIAFAVVIMCQTALSSEIVKTKNETIWSGWVGGTKEVSASWNCSDTCENPLILILVQDSRYTRISNLIRIFFGTPYDTHVFLSSILKLAEENKAERNEIKTTILGVKVTRSITYGKDYYLISENGGNGHHVFTIKNIADMNKSLIEWAKKNNISLTEPTVTVTSYSETSKKETKSTVEQIKEAKELLDAGVITKDEFEALKKKILQN